jgi:competence protein ComEC
MHRILQLIILLLCATAEILFAQASDLQIYWIDVEGGASTLIVGPGGQSLLVDTGNTAPDDRDSKRVYEVTQLARLKKIDYLLTTHFDGDHVGGAPGVAKLIPIEHFLDHGDSIDATKTPRTKQLWDDYQAIASGKRTIVKPGDKLPVKGFEAVVVSSNGEVITKAINGGRSNPFCAGAAQKEPDKTENQRSAGILLRYGKFTFVDLGDLTWDMEMQLACPIDKLGAVTMLQATHHGFVNGRSGAPALVWALKPQLVVVNNGPLKGWPVAAWDTVQKIQGLDDVWQLHLALATDKAHNTSEDKIANLEPTDECKGHWLKASITHDGKITLTNSRGGFSKTYTAR